MSTSVGSQAEEAASQYLVESGYEIIDRNWRTRVCEIDIIAKKASRVYFVEVKYRSTSGQGTGLDYITPKKLKQMRFAAECWVNENTYSGDFSLAGIEVGPDFAVTQYIDEIVS